ncbi:MAG: hypothetical protein MJ188_11320 [Treponema sp.]|nr:hypothetical protein [Treponema sp.]
MKKINSIIKIGAVILAGICILLTVSCGTTSVPTEEHKTEAPEVTQESAEEESDVTEVIEIAEPEKILRFNNWKYFGFGQELPVWVDAAFDEDLSAVMEAVPELAKRKIMIQTKDAETLDQAESSLSKMVDMDVIIDDEVFTLYERFWVQVKDEYVRQEGCEYCSLAILVSIEDETESEEMDF